MRPFALVDAQNMNAWLRQWAAEERRGELRRAMFRLGAGGGLLLLSSGGLAAVLLAGMMQLAEGVGAVLGRSLEVAFQLPLFLLLAGGVLFLLFAGNARSDHEAFPTTGELDWRDSLQVLPVLRAVAGIFAEVLYLGPRLWLAGLEAARRSREWQRMDFARAAWVLQVLHEYPDRVALAELAGRLPGADLAEALTELRLLPGVLLLESHPPGVSLSSELRRQLRLAARRADASAMPAEPQPAAEPAPPLGARSAKPPSFRCVECRRKFRLRNLRGGVQFHCPLCGAPYRTWTNAQGRVHVEHRTGDSHGVPLADTVCPAGSHAVLGVAPDASRAEIKQAYRRLMKEHHPDRVAGLSPGEQAEAEEHSKRINRAYAELSGRA